MLIDYYLFTDSELKQFAQEEYRKHMQHLAQAEACEQTVYKLQTELAERAINRKSLCYGDLVTVEFRGYRRDFRFEGLKWCQCTGRPQVRLRAFTTKGKPYKRAGLHDPSVIPFITRKDQPNG